MSALFDRWRYASGELIPVEVVDRWVDDALDHTPTEAQW